MNNVSYGDFGKLDLRVGEVLEIEDIPGADKLYNLTVDCGERRVIVAGIKEHYTKEALLGSKIIVVANLEPKEIKGILSHGMLLAASAKGADGAQRLSIVTLEKYIQNGAKVS
jgi:methionyl-tRNA synthetase